MSKLSNIGGRFGDCQNRAADQQKQTANAIHHSDVTQQCDKQTMQQSK